YATLCRSLHSRRRCVHALPTRRSSDLVRLYASGQPGGARSDKLLYQAKLALDPELRLKVVRKMFELRFGEPAPAKRSVDQLRGIDRKSTRLNSSHVKISYAVFCLKKKQ